MWKGLVNSVTLATTTHGKMGEMFDGTCTQVKVQIINKCKVLMTSRVQYKRRESPRKRDGKKRKKEQKRERKTITFDQEQKCTHTSPRTRHPVDMNEIFLRLIVAWPKVN